MDKIDSDTDGLVSQEELKDWIRFTQRRYITDDVDRQWKTHNPEDKEKISWDEYKKMLYGFMDGEFLMSFRLHIKHQKEVKLIVLSK